MALTGTDALNRSQVSAEAETGSIDSPVKECSGWIGVKAVYDDPWATPITDCQVRIEILGSLVADGPRTKALLAFGKQDGQPHADVRAELGGYRQNGVKPGPADIRLVPNGDPGLAKELEKQIYSQLSAFEASMRVRLQPWTTEWSKEGWWSVPEAKRRGQLRGLGAWWTGEMEFWSGVSDGAKDTWAGIKRGASKIATWYDDQPWYKKASPVLLLWSELGELGQELWNGTEEFWGRRDQLMRLLKAFSSGSVAAIQAAFTALTNLPGELGKLIKALVKDSADWVQNMIEVARETDVFKRVTNTIMAVVMMMTPNFWAEGISMVEGYLLPEVLITIVLILIGALCTAAGATALAARITGMLSRLRNAIEAAGTAGKVLKTLFDNLSGLARSIGTLSKELRRRIDEAFKGATDKLNRLVRTSAKKDPLEDAIRKELREQMLIKNKKEIDEGRPPRYPDLDKDVEESLENYKLAQKRGYPYPFTSKKQYDDFNRDLYEGVRAQGYPVDEIRIQGSATHRPTAKDVDIAVLMSPEEFDDLAQKSFKNPVEGTNAWRSKQLALDRGMIFPGNLKPQLSSVRDSLIKKYGIDVDLSVVRRGSARDVGPFFPPKTR